MSERKFSELRQRSGKKKGVCSRCGKELETGEVRGRIQIVLSSLKYGLKNKGNAKSPDPRSKAGAPAKNEQHTIASFTRVYCEGCSVEMYEQMLGLVEPTGRYDSDEGAA